MYHIFVFASVGQFTLKW